MIKRSSLTNIKPLAFLVLVAGYWMIKFSETASISISLLLGLICLAYVVLARHRIDRTTLKIIAILFILNVLWFYFTLITNPIDLPTVEIIRSAVNNAYFLAFTVLVCAALPTRSVSSAQMRWTYIAVIAGVLILCILERNGLLTFESLRVQIYREDYLYINDLRDRSLVGFIRPKLIAAEPSVVSSFVAILLTLYRLSGGTRALTWAFATAFWAIIGSPYALLPIALTVYPTSKGVSRFSRSMIAPLLAVLGIYSVLVSAVALSDKNVFVVRDASDYRRIVLPIELALDAMAQNPLVGFGMGSWDKLSESSSDSSDRNSGKSSGNFLLFVAVHQAGMIGFAIVLLLFHRYVMTLGFLNGVGTMLVLSVILGSPYGSAIFYIVVIEHFLRKTIIPGPLKPPEAQGALTISKGQYLRNT